MDLYQHKKHLAELYKNHTKDDLLWILAINSFQKATFTGSLDDYLSQYVSKLTNVKNVIRNSGAGEKSLTDLQFKYISSAGSSGAQLFKSSVDGIPVMLKLTDISDNDEQSVGVLYEILILKHFFNYMIENNITPNIPFYFGSNIGLYKGDESCFLFSEFMDGESLEKRLTQLSQTGVVPGKIPLSIWRSILFQILYTLLCFQQMNIRHNDIHISNIFIDPNVSGKIQYFISNDTHYTVPLTGVGLVKIFDMDMAAVDCTASTTPAIKNLHSEFSKELNWLSQKKYLHCDNIKTYSYTKLGIVPRGQSLFDTFIFICTLLSGVSHKSCGYYNSMDLETKLFMNRIFSISELDKNTGFHCRNATINAKSDKTLLQILEDDYFKVYRNLPDSTKNIYHLPYLQEPQPVKAQPQPVKAQPQPVKAQPQPVKAQPQPVKPLTAKFYDYLMGGEY